MQIRVSTEDADRLNSDGRFCHGPLCHTTSVSAAANKAFNCSTTLTGRYVTIQKYLPDNEGNWQLGVAEIIIYHVEDD